MHLKGVDAVLYLALPARINLPSTDKPGSQKRKADADKTGHFTVLNEQQTLIT